MTPRATRGGSGGGYNGRGRTERRGHVDYLTYCGNDLVNARLPEGSTVFFPPPPVAGIARRALAPAVRRALDAPLGMPPLAELVGAASRVLVAFDDNCQPFPPTAAPDVREVMIGAVLDRLLELGVDRRRIELRCAVALHRKMRPREIRRMVGARIMADFFPHQLRNFDAEDRDDIVTLEKTEKGEVVETSRAVTESDLVIYVDTVQIPLNGGHKSVAVGFGTYRSIAEHHSPRMTAESPHVMQPEGSKMHGVIERMSRVIQRHTRVLVIEAAMNNATYPAHLAHLGKPASRLNPAERAMKALTPLSMRLLPEPARRALFASIPSAYEAIEVNAGAIDEVHRRTLACLERQLAVDCPRQFSTLVFGLPDLSPYAVGARINPVLVVSDVLGYVFNWFYGRPFVKKGGVVIILNPTFEIFHAEYHVAYRRFYDEVLAETAEPFEMQKRFQERFATDPDLVDAYRNRYAHHGFHPFTVWYWATYPLSYLSRVILVGPRDDRAARRLGVGWAPDLDAALGQARELTGGDDVVGLTIPPFQYLRLRG